MSYSISKNNDNDKDADVHDALCSDICEVLKSYGLYTVSPINLPSPLFSWLVFNEKSDIDIYCHCKPFGDASTKGNEHAEVLASDFIIECKTGKNLGDIDKKKILDKARYFPVYVAFPSTIQSKLHPNDLSFLNKNHIGIMFFDRKNKILIISSPAYCKIFIEKDFGKNSVFLTPHKLFEIFNSKRNENILCLPESMQLLGMDEPSKSIMHELPIPHNLKDLIGLRTKIFKVFEKEGYELTESWSIFAGSQENSMIFHGFSLPCMLYAFEQIYENYQLMLNKKSTNISKIFFEKKPDSRLKSTWNNDDFVYCISATGGRKDALLFIKGNAAYWSQSKHHVRFHTAMILCGATFGPNLQESLGIQLHDTTSSLIENRVVRNYLIEDAPLQPIQYLTKTFNSRNSGTESDNPAYYFYKNDQGCFVINIYEQVNYNIWKNSRYKLEPRRKRYVDLSYYDIRLQSPLAYQTFSN